MYSLKVVIFIFYCTIYCRCDRINFSKCNFKGFTCVIINNKYHITYECPSGVNDVSLYINSFVSPTTTEELTIKNCKKLSFSFACTSERKEIKKLTIANITDLIIMKNQYSQNPTTIIFQNITNLENIPANTFAQVDPKNHKPGCIIPKIDMQIVYFDKVNIGTIESNAFIAQNIKNFTWTKVQVNRLEYSALKLNMDKDGVFLIHQSTLEVSEHLAFQINGKNVIFFQNKFVDILSSGINGTIETFSFTNNSVNNLQPYAISILSKTVAIKSNRFEYIKGGAFEKISPGLIQDSGINFGKLRFIYDFSLNYINFMDTGSLHPDVVAYENVASDVLINKNSIFCSCENVGWLVLEISHGYSSPTLQNFYEVVLDSENNNTCSYSCDLLLINVRKMMKDGKCMENITADRLCSPEKTTITFAPTRTTTKKKYKGITKNSGYMLSISSILVVLFIFGHLLL